jgi:flagellar biosynthesis/type III secretory pathway protein FliH
MEELIQEERKEARAEALEEGRAEGRKEGREEGREEGRAEGREEGREEGVHLFEQVLSRLKNGDSKENIMQDLSVSDEFIKRAQALLA